MAVIWLSELPAPCFCNARTLQQRGQTAIKLLQRGQWAFPLERHCCGAWPRALMSSVPPILAQNYLWRIGSHEFQCRDTASCGCNCPVSGLIEQILFWKHHDWKALLTSYGLAEFHGCAAPTLGVARATMSTSSTWLSWECSLLNSHTF